MRLAGKSEKTSFLNFFFVILIHFFFIYLFIYLFIHSLKKVVSCLA